MRKLTKGILLAATVGIGSCGVQTPAIAQAQCGLDLQTTVENLAKQYQEFPVFVGQSESGYVLQVFASKSGSFTILGVDAAKTCILDSGESATVTPVRAPESRS